MGTVEDVRKAIQDLVAPDLQALKAELKSVDERSTLRDEGVRAEIKGVDERSALRDEGLRAEIRGVDERSKLRDDALSAKIDSKFELIMAKMEANHATVMNALNIDRRLEALEQKAPVSMQAS